MFTSSTCCSFPLPHLSGSRGISSHMSSSAFSCWFPASAPWSVAAVERWSWLWCSFAGSQPHCWLLLPIAALGSVSVEFHIDAPRVSQVPSSSPPLSCGTSGYVMALIPLRVCLWCSINWLDSITNSMDTNLGKLRDIVRGREARCAAVHGVSKSQTRLSDWTPITYRISPITVVGADLGTPTMTVMNQTLSHKHNDTCIKAQTGDV